MIRVRRLVDDSGDRVHTNDLYVVKLEVYGRTQAIRNEKRCDVTRKCASPLDGIIAGLRRCVSGDTRRKGLIDSFLNADEDGDSLYNERIYVSLAEESKVCCLDFKDRRVAPTGYSIKIWRWRDMCPLSWVIEVSNDEKNWREIDRRENVCELHERDAVATFATEHCDEEYRFIRIRIQDGDRGDTHITDFEVFGGTEPIREPRATHIAFRPEFPWNGILAHLSRKCSARPCDNGLMEILFHSEYTDEDNRLGQMLIDPVNERPFRTLNNPSECLFFDFKDMMVIPSGCAMKCSPDSEVSNDGLEWTRLGRQQNDYEGILEEYKSRISFSVSPCDKAYRMHG